MIRLASESPFPYGWPGNSVCYFTMNRNKPVPMRSRDDMRAVLARKNPTIFAVWPGQWRSDMFIIDEVNLLREAVGVA